MQFLRAGAPGASVCGQSGPGTAGGECCKIKVGDLIVHFLRAGAPGKNVCGQSGLGATGGECCKIKVGDLIVHFLRASALSASSCGQSGRGESRKGLGMFNLVRLYLACERTGKCFCVQIEEG